MQCRTIFGNGFIQPAFKTKRGAQVDESARRCQPGPGGPVRRSPRETHIQHNPFSAILVFLDKQAAVPQIAPGVYNHEFWESDETDEDHPQRRLAGRQAVCGDRGRLQARARAEGAHRGRRPDRGGRAGRRRRGGARRRGSFRFAERGQVHGRRGGERHRPDRGARGGDPGQPRPWRAGERVGTGFLPARERPPRPEPDDPA